MTLVRLVDGQHLRYLPEVNLVGFVLRKLSRTAQHGLDGTRHNGVLPFHNELVAVARDEFHVHSFRAFQIAMRRFVLRRLNNKRTHISYAYAVEPDN